MDASALATRLAHYVTHRDAVAQDRQAALAFAPAFTPARYRRAIGQLLRATVDAAATPGNS
jgi:hypothetical protein